MAEGLKMMALDGHGIAFLPESAVTREVGQGLLARASAAGKWEIEMEIRLYRERPSDARPGKPIVAKLWDYLVAQQTGA
jgi:DNA-binding transcriptional LysR family regulator